MLAAAVASAKSCARGSRLLVRGRDGKVVHAEAVSAASTWLPLDNNSRRSGATPATETSVASSGAGLLALSISTRCVVYLGSSHVLLLESCPLCLFVCCFATSTLTLERRDMSGGIILGNREERSDLALLICPRAFLPSSVYLLRCRSHMALSGAFLAGNGRVGTRPTTVTFSLSNSSILQRALSFFFSLGRAASQRRLTQTSCEHYCCTNTPHYHSIVCHEKAVNRRRLWGPRWLWGSWRQPFSLLSSLSCH